jgi:hypothetical protein
MTGDRPFFRRPGCLLVLAGIVAIIVLVRWMIWYELRAYYTHEVLVRLSSATGEWTAVVSEDTVEGPLSTNIGASVELVSSAHPSDSIDLLGVETRGRSSLRPRIAWSAPNVLRVTVPNLSHLKVLTRHADGVEVDLHFDPDDPAARSEWLKRTGQSPD